MQRDYIYAALKNSSIFNGIKLNNLELTQIYKSEN